MVEAQPRLAPKGLLGRVAGVVTERVVDVVDPDIVIDHIDLNNLLEKIDLQRLLERVDLDPVLGRVDFEALLDRVDLNNLLEKIDLQRLLERVDLDPALGRVDFEALLDRVDLNAVLRRVDVDPLLDRVDVNRLLAQVDIEALVRRAGIAEIVNERTSELAGSALDLPRRQIAALDFWVKRGAGTVLRRPAGSVAAAPPLLAGVVSETEGGGRREVTGHYAGPVARLLAFVLDSVVVTVLYAGAGATLDWLARLFLDRGVLGPIDAWVSAVVLGTWLFLYFFGSVAVAGHTPGQMLVGVRVVSRSGTTLSPAAACLRTLCFPLSLVPLGLGLLGVVIGREHRALHDVLAGSAAVVDFGDRPAELPAPLSRFLEQQERTVLVGSAPGEGPSALSEK